MDHQENVREMYTPSKHNFLWKNWGSHGYTIFFLFLIQMKDCGFLLELHHSQCFEQIFQNSGRETGEQPSV